MGKTSIDQLKQKFKSGAKPSESDFSDLLDSFIHRDEDIASILIRIASISEAEQGTDNVKLMTPLLVKKAIYSLTRLSAITELANEVQAKIDSSINQLLNMDDADSLINTVKDVLDFVQGASEDLNIITELGKKVDKTMISHAIDSDSEEHVASSMAVNAINKGKANKNGDETESFRAKEISTQGVNSFISYNNEFNFVGKDYEPNVVLLNYRGVAPSFSGIRRYSFRTGKVGEFAALEANDLIIK
jgi:hypothetical protein